MRNAMVGLLVVAALIGGGVAADLAKVTEQPWLVTADRFVAGGLGAAVTVLAAVVVVVVGVIVFDVVASARVDEARRRFLLAHGPRPRRAVPVARQQVRSQRVDALER